MSDSEPDYLSEEVLQQCVTEDIRPGLLVSHANKRKHEMHKKKIQAMIRGREMNKPKKVLEEEKRSEGLQTAIGTENKGFAMMQRMGYKPGTSIGKVSNSALPIPIEIKGNRTGLGHDSAIKEKQAKNLVLLRKHQEKREKLLDPTEYRDRMRQHAHEKQILSALHKSQRVCERLDIQRGIKSPSEIWFWAKKELVAKQSIKLDDYDDDEDDEYVEEKEAKDESDEDVEEFDSEEEEKEMETEEVDDGIEPSEKLDTITSYLRTNYFYCLYCGMAYDNEKDLTDNCPGPTQDDH